MTGWLLRLLFWRLARRAGPIGLFTLAGGPFPRLALMALVLRYLGAGGRSKPR
jgi:hypothetical protein